MRINRLVILAAAAVALLAFVKPAAAQPFSIDWYTIDGGGAMNTTGGSFTLSGTIGQPDAGTMSGGSFTLNGGFWYPQAPALPPPTCDLDGLGDGATILDALMLVDIAGGLIPCPTSDCDFDALGDGATILDAL